MPYPYPYPPGAMQQAAMAMPYPMMAAPMPAPRASGIVYYPAPYPVSSPPAYAAAPLPRGEVAPSYASFAGASGNGYAAPVPPLDQWPAIGAAGPVSLGSSLI